MPPLATLLLRAKKPPEIPVPGSPASFFPRARSPLEPDSPPPFASYSDSVHSNRAARRDTPFSYAQPPLQGQGTGSPSTKASRADFNFRSTTAFEENLTDFLEIQATQSFYRLQQQKSGPLPEIVAMKTPRVPSSISTLDLSPKALSSPRRAPPAPIKVPRGLMSASRIVVEQGSDLSGKENSGLESKNTIRKRQVANSQNADASHDNNDLQSIKREPWAYQAPIGRPDSPTLPTDSPLLPSRPVQSTTVIQSPLPRTANRPKFQIDHEHSIALSKTVQNKLNGHPLRTTVTTPPIREPTSRQMDLTVLNVSLANPSPAGSVGLQGWPPDMNLNVYEKPSISVFKDFVDDTVSRSSSSINTSIDRFSPLNQSVSTPTSHSPEYQPQVRNLNKMESLSAISGKMEEESGLKVPESRFIGPRQAVSTNITQTSLISESNGQVESRQRTYQPGRTMFSRRRPSLPADIRESPYSSHVRTPSEPITSRPWPDNHVTSLPNKSGITLNLPIEVGQERALPRRSLVPHTPNSPTSDIFAWGGIASISSKEPEKKEVLAPVVNAPEMLPTSGSNNKSRTLPSGPRRPSTSTRPTGKAARGPANASGQASIKNVRKPRVPMPFSPNFDIEDVRFRGLTLDAARWTFTTEQLEAIVKRAIRHSADPFSIRLLPENLLCKELPAELEKLELEREELKAKYKYQYSRRVATLNSLNACLSESNPSVGVSPPARRLLDDLRDIGLSCDYLSQCLFKVSERISQIRGLQDGHSASALALALRKINGGFLKATAEASEWKAYCNEALSERDDAWALAERLEEELEEVKGRLQKQGLSEVLEDIKEDNASMTHLKKGRVYTAKRASIRASRTPHPRSVRSSGASIHSSRSSQIMSLNSALSSPRLARSSRPSQLYSGIWPASLRRSDSFSGAPSAATRALLDAQNELLEILGLPLPTEPRPLRRARSSSGLNPLPRVKQGSTEQVVEAHRSNFLDLASANPDLRCKPSLFRGGSHSSEFDMETIYDGILDDPETLFAVLKPGL